MIANAYSKNGKLIRLPKTGRAKLVAGTIVLEGKEFRTLTVDSLLVRSSGWDNLTQSREYHEDLIPLT